DGRMESDVAVASALLLMVGLSSHAARRRPGLDSSVISSSSVALPVPASRSETVTMARHVTTQSASQTAPTTGRSDMGGRPSACRFGMIATPRDSYIRLHLLTGT